MAWLEKPNGKNECDTAPTDAINQSRVAWRCSHCRQLMYLKDKNGNPAKGAPPAKFISSTYDRVCSLCWEMWMAISGKSYWESLHTQWETEQKKRKKNLGDGKDYFA